MESVDNYYRVKNVGTGEYMHIENQTGSVECSLVDQSYWSLLWSFENVEGTYLELEIDGKQVSLFILKI